MRGERRKGEKVGTKKVRGEETGGRARNRRNGENESQCRDQRGREKKGLETWKVIKETGKDKKWGSMIVKQWRVEKGIRRREKGGARER